MGRIRLSGGRPRSCPRLPGSEELIAELTSHIRAAIASADPSALCTETHAIKRGAWADRRRATGGGQSGNRVGVRKDASHQAALYQKRLTKKLRAVHSDSLIHS
jgi:hypothetical protein